MSSIRTWHAYLGLLIAPSVLFFCFTGALQLFGLHEARDAYRPAPVIEKLGMLHKDQVFALGERHERQPEPEAGARHEEHDEEHGEPAATQLLLKCFFLLVAIGLSTSTSVGIWMGLTHVRHKRIGRILLASGVLLPVALAFL